MKPGEVQIAEFEMLAATPNDMNRYCIKYRAEAGGVVQEDQQIVQVACATYGTPKIDGDLSDWNKTIGVTMISRGSKDWREITMDPSLAAARLAQKQAENAVVYRVWTQWDEKNFYMAAAVPDDTPTFAAPYQGVVSSVKNMPFMNDCLQLAFHCLASQSGRPALRTPALREVHGSRRGLRVLCGADR